MWEPFLTEKVHNEFIGENVKVQKRQKNAPNVFYTKPRANTFKLEDQIKRFITGKFEDERIATIKKTTSWNIEVGKDLTKVIKADRGL